MKKPEYLLLGWKPKKGNRRISNLNYLDTITMPGKITQRALGDAKAVIAAAVAADCGVLLFEVG